MNTAKKAISTTVAISWMALVINESYQRSRKTRDLKKITYGPAYLSLPLAEQRRLLKNSI